MRSLAVSVVTLALLLGCSSSNPNNNLKAGPPDLARSALTADRISGIAADGADYLTLTVTLKDASGNPVADQVVQLAVSGTGNTVSTPAKTNASGRTTATFSSIVAEAKMVTATLSQGSLAPLTVTFIAGPPTELAFVVPPSNAAAGATMSPAVQVKLLDAHGNRVDNGAAIQLALGNNSAGATLSGTLSRTVVGGIANFDNLSVNKVGTGYNLVASSTGVPSVASAAFDITIGAGSRLAFVTQPSATTSGVVMSPAVQVAIVDAGGNLVTSASAPVRLALQGGVSGASLSGTVTVTTVNGVATFSDLRVDKAATYQLAATATGFTGATSASFDVGPGSAAQLAFVQQPSNVVAGSNISPAVAVAVEDAAGNVVTSSTRTIALNLNPNAGGGTLSGAASVAANAVNGIATFPTLTLNKAATGYGLRASNSGLASAYSNYFDVSPGAATQLAFTTQPTVGQNGVALAPIQVSVEDAFGNVLTSDTRMISLAIANNPSGAILSGTTSVAANAGVAHFSNLSLDMTGTGYTLRASAGSLTAGVSAAFDITPAPITGTAIAHVISETGVVTDTPTDLSSMTIAVHVPLADGGYVTYPGSGTADGRFSIPNVPTTTYVLQYGANYFPSSTRTWDLGSTGVRPDAWYPGANTLLVTDLSSMTPWTDGDDLQLVSLNAGVYVDWLQYYAAEPLPNAGDTVWHGTIDYAQLPIGLMDGSKGDQVLVTQLRAQTTEGGLTYQGASNGYSGAAPVMVNGQTNTLTASLPPLAQSSTSLLLDFPSFEDELGEVFDGGSFVGDVLALDQIPVTTYGQYANTPDVVELQLSDAGTPAQIATFNYGLVNPNWGQIVVAYSQQRGPPYTLPLSDGGTSSAAYGYGSLSYLDTLAQAKSGGVRLALSPVRRITINGINATTSALKGVGTAPVVSWTAPAIGVPTAYRVVVTELKLNGDLIEKGPSSRVWATTTTVRIPPGTLQAGHSYYLTVEAWLEPARDVTSRPFEFGFPAHSSDALTQMITP